MNYKDNSKFVRVYPHALKVAYSVAKVTFLEVIRDKLLYNLIVISLLLFGLGILASQLTFVRPERVILDFGISAVTFSNLMIALLVGANLLIREFERRTIYVALSHPITKFQYVLGKYFGICGILVLNWSLLCICLTYLLYLFRDPGSPIFSSTLMIAFFFCLIQSLIMASLALFFSAFSTTSLAVIFCFGLYLIGSNVSQVRLIAIQTQSQINGIVLKFITYFVPNFEFFYLGSRVTYAIPVGTGYFLSCCAYGVMFIALLLSLTGLVIQFKEV